MDLASISPIISINYHIYSGKHNKLTIQIIHVINTLVQLFLNNHFFFSRLSGQNLIPETSYQNLAEDSMERQIIDTLTEFYTNFAKFA